MNSFQNSNSPYLDNLIAFHNMTFMFILIIISMTMFILVDILINKFTNRFLLKNHMIETLWTLMPMLILIFICIPSLKILYFIDESLPVNMTIKSIGHQWYWSYEYPDFEDLSFDSYMLNISDSKNLFRLLDVDNRIVIPYGFLIRMITTSMDVIHSWTIPSLGLKIDSVPGRMNQMILSTIRPGLYFGQCSEICGANHSFMPIVIESTSLSDFMNWVNNYN
uniref:cytochrome c oxidase subunit II n=1 Tax=Melecta chinensis TaxID=582934 RepID=UPI002551CEB5|nr:cytochrome c oxidase subunit II [Melecta chinensis]WFP44652.1 cytochrome c oxidase subunit 2 [Melecta chinensis]